MIPDESAVEKEAKAACDRMIALGMESAILIVSWTDEGGTSLRKFGSGNYYAQRGSVIDLIDSTREVNITNPPTEEGDWWKEN